MATYIWIRADKGIRYREHPTRKHGIKLDRYFTLRFYIEGKRVEEALGWASEGWTLERSRTELAKLKEARRTGQGAPSLREARADAKIERKHTEDALAEQVLIEMSFATFWEEQYLPSTRMTKSPKSVKTEEGLYRNWLRDVIGDIPLKKLGIPELNAVMQAALDAKKSPSTIQYILAVVSQVWNTASLHGLVDGRNPTTLIKKPKIDNRRMRFLTKDEARALLDALREKSIDTHDAALFSLFGGLRIGEIHALQWIDVNFENGFITIRDPKNKQNRYCYMTDEIRAALVVRFTEQAKNSLVFPSTTGGERQFISKTFERVVQKLGLNQDVDDPRNKLVFHSLRHTFASWLVQKGTPLYTVAELMGHSTLDMTKRYAHLAPDTMRTAALTLSGELNI